MSLHRAPVGWSQDRVDAFNALIEAVVDDVAYRQLIQALNITDPVLLQRRADLDNLITGQLLPAFKNAP